MFTENTTLIPLINYADLNVGVELGRGGFGVVYQGTYRYNDVAIKQLLIDNISLDSLAEFEKESKIMAQLHSPNIVHFYGYCVSPHYCIVMEYMSNGSLFSVLRSNKPLEWPQRFSIALDIAKGLAFLHHENILHRDIKSLNVLLDQHNRAKLTDFGLSKVKAETRSHATATKTNTKDSVGTIQWMAPELFEGRKAVYTKKSDIYSLGVTFWELASRKIPFSDAANPNLISVWVAKGEREDIPADCPPLLAKLIQQSWEGEVDKRPTADDIVIRLKSALESYVIPVTNSDPQSVMSAPQYKNNLSSNTIVSEPVYQDNFSASPAPVALPSPIPSSSRSSSPSLDPSPYGHTYGSPLVFSSNHFASSVVAKLPTHTDPLPILTPKVDLKTSSTFLQLVAEGEQDQAEALLQQSSELALMYGNVTDLSSRTFNGITGFQYAVWALDWHMWTMIRKYLPNDVIREQLQEMASASWVNQYGRSASWQNLIDALQKFLDLCRQKKFQEADICWAREVGGAQCLLPVHVINEYCQTRYSFEPYRNFSSMAQLPRTRLVERDGRDWFTISLGETVGVRWPRGVEGARVSIGDSRSKSHLVSGHQEACLALYKARTQQREQLFSEFTLEYHDQPSSGSQGRQQKCIVM